jgi:hypothetical protein
VLFRSPDGREQLPVMEDWVTQFMQIPTPLKVNAIAAGQLS